MIDLVSTVQALAENFDAATASDTLGSFTKKQLSELQTTLAEQLESLQKADADPNRERKLENLKKLRELVQDTMRGALRGLLVNTLSSALKTRYGEVTPDILESYGVTPDLAETLSPTPKPRRRESGAPSASAFDNRAIVGTGLPSAIVGSELPTDKGEKTERLSFEEYRQMIDPSRKMPNMLLNVRYFFYQSSEFVKGMFGGLFGRKKNVPEPKPAAKPEEGPLYTPPPAATGTTEKPAATKPTETPAAPAVTPTEVDSKPNAPATNPNGTPSRLPLPGEDPFDLQLDPDAFGPKKTTKPRGTDIIDPSEGSASPIKKPKPAVATPPEGLDGIPERVTFDELKRGPVTVSKYTISLFGPNGIEVNKQKWALLYTGWPKVNVQFKNIMWENGKLTIKGEAASSFARGFGGTDEDNTMALAKQEALEMLEYLAKSRTPYPLKTKEGKSMNVTLTPLS